MTVLPDLSPVRDVTRLLAAIQHGDPRAGAELLPLVYAELRQLARAKMSREQPGHTLQPTALVHEAWLRLGEQCFENRLHFFGAAAEAMRRILVESARRRHREKRGAGAEHLDLDKVDIAAPAGAGDELLSIHEVLDRLAAEAPQKAELVKLRFFVGLSPRGSGSGARSAGAHGQAALGLCAGMAFRCDRAGREVRRRIIPGERGPFGRRMAHE